MDIINKKRFYKYCLFISIIVGIISVLFLYLINYNLISDAFINYEGAFQVVLILSLRIILLCMITTFLFNRWFKQEAQYLTDIPFLLSLFFLILIFGKTVDLFVDLTFFTFNDEMFLLLNKIRFLIIVLEVAPLIYLGFEIIFFRLEDKYQKLKNKPFMNKFRTRLVAIIVSIESLIIILSPNITILGVILPIILIPSLFGIVYIFYLAYRLNRLSVVKPKILTIGFFLYMISNIFRPLMQSILGETANYIIVVESVDLIIFLVIFLGLYKKK